MKNVSISKFLVAVLFLALAASGAAARQNDAAQDKSQSSTSDSRKMQVRAASGQKMKVQGTILKRDGNTFIMRDTTGQVGS